MTKQFSQGTVEISTDVTDHSWPIFSPWILNVVKSEGWTVTLRESEIDYDTLYLVRPDLREPLTND